MEWLRTAAWASLALLLSNDASQGFGGRLRSAGSTSQYPVLPMSYAMMYPAMNYSVAPNYFGQLQYCPTAPMVFSLPPMPLATTAQPVPAPPSTNPAPKTGQTKEPPLGDPFSNPKRGPSIIESRSLGGQYADGSPTGIKDRCKVGFWNVSGKDVKLKVGTREYQLPSNRAITLELERQFAWQIGLREANTEVVPDNQGFFEVIIRE